MKAKEAWESGGGMERAGEKKESSYHMSSDQKAKKVQAILEWKK